jgi:hypothetical protein
MNPRHPPACAMPALEMRSEKDTSTTSNIFWRSAWTTLCTAELIVLDRLMST